MGPDDRFIQVSALYFLAGLLGLCLFAFGFFVMRGSGLAAAMMVPPTLLLGALLRHGLKETGLL